MQVERAFILFIKINRIKASGKRVSKARELTCQSDPRFLFHVFLFLFYVHKKDQKQTKQEKAEWRIDLNIFLTFLCFITFFVFFIL